jgi:C_GCAxxG_C_C family probable redox protein
MGRELGMQTPYLIRAIAAALLFDNPDDAGAVEIQHRISQEGLEAAIRQTCGLKSAEDDLVEGILKAYDRLSAERKWHELAADAERLGFDYEQTYHGCGQSVVAAVLETIGEFDEGAFRAATPLAGGQGMVGDSTCSALTGADMAFGIAYPRRREFFGGDRENKYRSYAMARELRQRFLDEYGTITCYDIHRSIMGKAFNLLDADELKAFEAAGAHDDKCTNVVAKAARWAVEIIGRQRIDDEMGQEDSND